MKFCDVFDLMVNKDAKIKRSIWHGYWCFDSAKKTIMIHCQDGTILDMRETSDMTTTISNVLMDDWEVVEDKTQRFFSFSEALARLKAGEKVARMGWNGKTQYVELATSLSYTNSRGKVVNCNHDAIGNNALAFVGTSGVQIGWLASQSDLLADDWYEVK